MDTKFDFTNPNVQTVSASIDDQPAMKNEVRTYSPVLNSDGFGEKLVELGIVPRHCISVRIEASLDGPVTITARYYADERIEGCLEAVATWKAARELDSESTPNA